MAKSGQIFRANVGYNTTHGNEGGGIHPYLSHQFQGMRSIDPGEKAQKPYLCAFTHANFDVKGECQTKMLCFRNIQYFSKNKLIPNDSPKKFSAVSI
jgi:hypothetical protein